MKRNNIFWGGVLILLGVLFLLQTQNIIPSIFPYLWPIALILVGGWMILNVYWRPTQSEQEIFSIPLGEAKSIKYKFSHGAGQIEIKDGAPTGQALVGSSAAGMNTSSQLDGDRLNIKVEAGASFVPFVGPENGVFRFQLPQGIPVMLNIETGASQLDLDLKDVLATDIRLQTGASNSNVTLPSHGASHLDLEAGAASISIRVPEGVAARIRVKEGLTSLNVNTNRFPQLDSHLYQSPDFDSATDRAEINIEAGLGSFSVQ